MKGKMKDIEKEGKKRRSSVIERINQSIKTTTISVGPRKDHREE